MFPKTYPLCLLLGGILLCSRMMRGDGIYNFDGDAVGTTTPFTNVSVGLQATFSSQVPNAFIVQALGTPSPYSGLSGNVLAENTAAGVQNQALTISLDNTSFNSVFFNFIVDAITPTPLTVSAFLDGNLVGTATASERIPTGNNLPEGFISLTVPYESFSLGYRARAFNSVVISTAAPGFAIDNVDFVPEPGSFSLVGIAFFVTTTVLLRRKHRI